ncbi:hypothetical protein [Hymenobacter jeollabukensis]|uniref:Uncharacterized protein n=1 Tax=Hymenobacter jeollabukensis TaxID=2025313 RepID=A0A5R8WSW9_9BACT|nr:hypothetical protein [Hymenobacter jeollabukensis]TLM94262.1 hypothetical protein FDY95_09650 [Hymenobacter jeollabukensis]
MAEYHATADGNRHFTLTQGAHPLGQLVYPKWFAFEATLTLADQSAFEVKPKGFWGTTIELLQDGRPLMRFKMGWNGNIILHAAIPGQLEQDFVFKQQGFFKNRFVLTDAQHQELLAVQPDFKWKQFAYEYALATTDAFEALAFKPVLLLLIVHCANYYMTMMSAAVAAT